MKSEERKVKCTVHREITSVKETPFNVISKIVKISVSGPCAPDCSSDNENVKSVTRATRVKRCVEEIGFCRKDKVFKRKKPAIKAVEINERMKYRGVRCRPWGKYSAEIYDPETRSRKWLGPFNTPKEAALCYDRAVIQLKGVNAKTNFLKVPSCPPPAVVPETPVIKSLWSVTSVPFRHRKKETKYRTGPVKLLSEPVNKENPASSLSDTYILPDRFRGGDRFRVSEIGHDPMFVDEMQLLPNNNTDCSKDPIFTDSFPLSMIGNFKSLSLDMDATVQDHLMD